MENRVGKSALTLLPIAIMATNVKEVEMTTTFDSRWPHGHIWEIDTNLHWVVIVARGAVGPYPLTAAVADGRLGAVEEPFIEVGNDGTVSKGGRLFNAPPAPAKKRIKGYCRSW